MHPDTKILCNDPDSVLHDAAYGSYVVEIHLTRFMNSLNKAIAPLEVMSATSDASQHSLFGLSVEMVNQK
jgi:hypothetical protein